MRPFIYAVLALLVVGAPGQAAAQTNDHLFRSWRWTPSQGSPRASGLAGAFVAVADDTTAAFLNPAGLSLIPKNEIGGAFLQVPAYSVGIDRATGSSGLGYIAGVGKVSRHLAVGGYITTLTRGRLDLTDTFLLPDGSRISGYLDATLVEGGAAAAYGVGRVRVGVRLTASHLALAGLYRREGVSGLMIEGGTAAGNTRVTASLGLLCDVSSVLRAGLVIAPGSSYGAVRTANGPDGALDQGSRYEVRQPALISAGLALRPHSRWLVSGQVDYSVYSQITPFLRPGTFPNNAYESHDAVQPHLAAEYSWPMSSAALQLRGGVLWYKPGAIHFVGADPTESATFTGSSREIVGTAGITLALRRGAAVDLAAQFGRTTNQITAGVRFRF